MIQQIIQFFVFWIKRVREWSKYILEGIYCGASHAHWYTLPIQDIQLDNTSVFNMIIYLQFHFIWGNKYMHLQTNHISQYYVTYVELYYSFSLSISWWKIVGKLRPAKENNLL